MSASAVSFAAETRFFECNPLLVINDGTCNGMDGKLWLTHELSPT